MSFTEPDRTGPRPPKRARSKASSLRAVLLLIATLLVLVGGFLLYLTFQPVPTSQSRLKLHPAPFVSGERSGAFNSGRGVWVKKYDAAGQLASQLRAVQYDPVGPDTIHVTQPEARFFLSDGQVLRITGAEGTVSAPSATSADQRTFAGAPTDMPQRGRLEDVKLELYSLEEIHRLDQNLPAHSQLTATMNNAVFDANASRIYTDDCTINDRHVPGHQVPVVVTGDDYDFSGYGLQVRWNEQIHQLTLLEIHRGQSLTVKHPGDMRILGRQSPTGRSDASAKPAKAPEPATQPPAPTASTSSKPSAQPPSRATPSSPPAYRATFEQDVLILQGEQLLARAMIMQVDFLPRSPSTPSNNKPHTPGPSTPATTPSAPATTPTVITAAPLPPAEQPIVIHWSGPLRVTPLPTSEGGPLAGGQTAVHLLGAPVTLTRENETLTAASVLYRSQDQSIELHGLPEAPVVMADGRGATLSTQSMVYHPNQHTAELAGIGHASGLADARQLDARWSEQALIYFRPGASQNQMDIESVSLRGNVRIDHPQLNLQSDRLQLAFAPTSVSRDGPGANDLHSLTATGNVRARLLDEEKGEQRLSSGKLDLIMGRSATGQSYPQLMQADDQVHAQMSGDDQQLWADHLTVHLTPAPASDSQTDAPQAQIALQSLAAQGHVCVTNSDSRADADELLVAMTDARPRITLTGQPARLSSATGDNLTGPVIHYAPDQRTASVIGEGQLTATQQTGGTSRPLHVTWTDGIHLDADANRIDVNGSVVTTSTADDGAVQTARGDRLTLWLADSRATPATRRTASTGTGMLTGTDANFMQNKEVRQAEFNGNASLQSLLSADGRVLRRLYLQAPRIEYDVTAQRLVVPTAGQMLVEDHQSSGTPTTTAPSTRGNTAFAWTRQLSFDQSARQASLVGDVRIIHQPDAQTSGIPFTLQSQQVTAEFSPSTGREPSAEPSAEPSQPNFKLKTLSANDSVQIVSQGRQVDADRITYDPITGLLDAIGSARQPVRLHSEDATLRGQFESLTYNIREDRIIKMEKAQFQGRGQQ